MVVFPTLQFSGTGAPSILNFLAALEAQLLASSKGFHYGEIAGRLTGRALLCYSELKSTLYVARRELRAGHAGFNQLSNYLRNEFWDGGPTPRRAFRSLTQGADNVAEYAEKYQALAAAIGEDVNRAESRLSWAYGLQPDIRDIAFDLMAEYQGFVQLAEAVHAAELKIACKMSAQVKAKPA